jgi:hypothetical protein
MSTEDFPLANHSWSSTPITLHFHSRLADHTEWIFDFAMAEMDEDVIPRGPDVGDIDLSDETQDFRFLLNFTCVAHLCHYIIHSSSLYTNLPL